MDFFKKIQRLSESKRKIILWTITIIIGLTLTIIWIKKTEKNLKNLGKNFQVPSVREKIKELPKPNLFEFFEEELKEIKKESTSVLE